METAALSTRRVRQLPCYARSATCGGEERRSQHVKRKAAWLLQRAFGAPALKFSLN